MIHLVHHPTTSSTESPPPQPGHCFTIEPMISEGVWGDQTWPDNWTSVTQDGKLSAQFEQTMVVTDTGVEVGEVVLALVVVAVVVATLQAMPRC